VAGCESTRLEIDPRLERFPPGEAQIMPLQIGA
jgi:hypothetical protein